jgi:hypothetical protein
MIMKLLRRRIKMIHKRIKNIELVHKDDTVIPALLEGNATPVVKVLLKTDDDGHMIHTDHHLPIVVTLKFVQKQD